MNNAKINILVIEDHLIARKIAIAVLEDLNCHVDAAENGIQAIDFFNKKSYDLILVDIGLPYIDGFEVVKEIRLLQNNLQKLPIVALTAHTDALYRRRCVEAGMNDCIVKPLTTENAKLILENFIPEIQNRLSSERTNAAAS